MPPASKNAPPKGTTKPAAKNTAPQAKVSGNVQPAGGNAGTAKGGNGAGAAAAYNAPATNNPAAANKAPLGFWPDVDFITLSDTYWDANKTMNCDHTFRIHMDIDLTAAEFDAVNKALPNGLGATWAVIQKIPLVAQNMQKPGFAHGKKFLRAAFDLAPEPPEKGQA